KAMPVSERFYLADAVFLAAVAGEEELIRTLHTAVRAPVYLPYLGRRSCPPQGPVDLGIREGDDAAAALRREPWYAAEWHQRRHSKQAHVPLQLLAEASADAPRGTPVRDQPVTFAPEHRRYALRNVVATVVDVLNPYFRPDEAHPTNESPRRVTVPRHSPEAHLALLPPQSPLDGH
ncbi:type I-E CRISPR-associated protein Cas5/CasD, partial [Streptomyces katrae]